MVENSKSGLMSWDSLETKTKAKINFLRMKGDNEYRVRLIGSPKVVKRYFNEETNRSVICGDINTCPLHIKYGLNPKARYGILVLDRKDGGTVKVLEAPAQVFEDFKKYRQANDKDPSGENAPDFMIYVTGQKVNTRYSVIALAADSPFTEEEKVRISNARSNGYDLDSVFKPTDPQKAEAIYFNTSNAGETKQETQSAKTESHTPQSGRPTSSSFKPTEHVTVADSDIAW